MRLSIAISAVSQSPLNGLQVTVSSDYGAGISKVVGTQRSQIQAVRQISILNNKPTRPAPRTTGMISHFHLVMPIKATTPTTTANQSTVLAAGKMTCSPNQTPRFNTTPTTAAVTADNAVVSPSFPRSCSI